MDSSIMDTINPWEVKSLEEFLYYNCPECPDRSTNRDEFINHAWENHPKSQMTLIALKMKLEEEVQNGETLEVKLEDAYSEIKPNLDITETTDDFANVGPDDLGPEVDLDEDFDPTDPDFQTDPVFQVDDDVPLGAEEEAEQKAAVEEKPQSDGKMLILYSIRRCKIQGMSTRSYMNDMNNMFKKFEIIELHE